MNTRGLTELIALSIGRNAGIIGQRLFTVLVLMAVITTLITAPLLSLIQGIALPPATELLPVAPSPAAVSEP